jgi:hypothetical protein
LRVANTIWIRSRFEAKAFYGAYMSYGADCWQRSNLLGGSVAVSIPALLRVLVSANSMFAHLLDFNVNALCLGAIQKFRTRLSRTSHMGEVSFRGSALSYISKRIRKVARHTVAWDSAAISEGNLRVVAANSSSMEAHYIQVAFGVLARAHWS